MVRRSVRGRARDGVRGLRLPDDLPATVRVQRSGQHASAERHRLPVGRHHAGHVAAARIQDTSRRGKVNPPPSGGLADVTDSQFISWQWRRSTSCVSGMKCLQHSVVCTTSNGNKTTRKDHALL